MFLSYVKVGYVIADTGASRVVCCDKREFVGPIIPTDGSLGGIGEGRAIEGEGDVEWCFQTADGRYVAVILPAYYVPGAKYRLLSPQILCDTLNGTLTRSPNDPLRITWIDSGSKQQVKLEFPFHGQSNVPTLPVYSKGVKIGMIDVLNFTKPIAAPFVTDDANLNLSTAQKILLRLHYRLCHVSFRQVQWLVNHGVFGPSTKSAGNCSVPKCHACELMKAKRRSSKASTSRRTSHSRGALVSEDLSPGQRISVDFFKSPVPGRGRTSVRGSLSSQDNLVGGMIAVDHASSKIFVSFQTAFSSAEAVRSKIAIETQARHQGVVFQNYLGDNDRAFQSVAFQKALASDWQQMRFSGAHAHHQNGKAERSIGTIFSLAGAMMTHAWTRWPERQDSSLWPLAVSHAVHVWNMLPNPSNGLSPEDVFSGSLVPMDRLSRLHVWGCPAYVLDPTVAEGRKLPKWSPRSRRGMFVGYDSHFASSVGLILNPEKRTITPQFHVVYDDWFSTTYSNGPDPPPEWALLFEHSCENHLDPGDDNSDGAVLVPHPSPDWMSEIERLDRLGSTAPPLRPSPLSSSPTTLVEPTRRITVSNASAPPPSPATTTDDLPDSDPPNSVSPLAHRSLGSEFERVAAEQVATEQESVELPETNLSSLDHSPLPLPEPPDQSDQLEPNPPIVRFADTLERTSPSSSPPVPATGILRQEPDAQREARLARQAALLRDAPPRRTRRRRKDKDRQERVPQRRTRSGRIIKPRDIFSPSVGLAALHDELEDRLGLSSLSPSDSLSDLLTSSLGTALAATLGLAAKTSTPDLPSAHDALNGPDADKYIEAMKKEIKQLEEKDTWLIVDRASLPEGANVLPGTWAFRRKRSPDGTVKSHKARFCVRGDRQKEGVDFFETYAPVVSWSTVRLLLTLSVIHDLETRQVDYTNAFVQADLHDDEHVYIELPDYFGSRTEGDVVLKLKKSLYGLKQAPLRWFEWLRNGLIKRGFSQCEHEPCLFSKNGVIILVYVDDCLFFGKNGQILDETIRDLKQEFDLKHEGDVGAFLGIDIVRNDIDGSFTLKQPYLIKKVLDTVGMSECSSARTPANTVPLGRLEDSPEPKCEWNYATVVGMLMYLASNSRPDIAFAVHQCARFSHKARTPHEQAVKRICRYLRGTSDRGLILSPTNRKELIVNCYVDADFAGLWGAESDQSPMCVKSRTGYVLTLNDCPLVWVSKLQTEIALSTMEAEYIALAQAMREVIPTRRMVTYVGEILGLIVDAKPIAKSTVFEDNNGALRLATVPKMTPRSKHIAIKYHFFREHVFNGTVDIEKIDTSNQKADIFTKGLGPEIFERVRELLMGW